MSLDACSGCVHGSQCSKATHHPDALRISVSLANSNAERHDRGERPEDDGADVIGQEAME